MKQAFFLLLLSFTLRAQTPVGIIDGQATDAVTRTPLIGANILLANTTLGAVTDADGRFRITAVPVGSYTVQFRMVGYAPEMHTDVIVRPQRTTTVNGVLKEQSIESEQVVVTAGYFRKDDRQPVSITALSAEEIRRAPGSGGDISRVVMSLPSIAKVNDQSNSLIVRGGSPMENAFFLDGIEVPNINHFPASGGTGGPIGMVNVDLIEGVQFVAGGFSAAYGDRMSSVMEMTLREGNRTEFEAQLDLNIAGFGGVAEGPLGTQASYVVSLRRSYLDYLATIVDLGTTAVPRYGDLQAKVVWDVAPEHRLTFITLNGDDHNAPDRAAAEENDMIFYGRQDIGQHAGGVAWRALWSGDLYSLTTLGAQATIADEDFYETNTGLPLLRNRSTDGSASLRNTNHWRISPLHALEFGVEVKQLFASFDNRFGVTTGALGDSIPAAAMSAALHETKLSAFASYTIRPFGSVSITIGARSDYFTYNDRMSISPRASLSYQMDELTSFSISSGMYRQSLPASLLAQSAANNGLKDPYAVHYIAGADRLLNEDTKLTLEVYLKEYYDFPVDPSDPSLFLADEVFYRNGLYFHHAPLVNAGAARSYGAELTLQKKLAEDVYGLVSATYFRTEYRGADGIWRSRVFDNRVILSAEGGYKPSAEWEFSARWIYAGGTPYTTFDLARSAQAQRGVFDASRINAEQYPAYHSLNVRVDKRFHFAQSNLVLYLSAWNAYNRKNVAAYFWNEKENRQSTLYQWNLLPIFGAEYEL